VSKNNIVSFFIITFGCKINLFESQRFSNKLLKEGYCETDSENGAGIVIINSCAVTNKTEKKILRVARKIKKNNQNCFLVIAGCFGKVYPEKIKKNTSADVVAGNLLKSGINDILNLNFNVSNCSFKIPNFSHRTRFFLKITDGCNNKSSVPFVILSISLSACFILFLSLTSSKKASNPKSISLSTSSCF